MTALKSILTVLLLAAGLYVIGLGMVSTVQDREKGPTVKQMKVNAALADYRAIKGRK